ncbi:hypothetical protein PHMEG_0008521 [Phytophthora megakarya]|uniref:Reverse transcriptase/retrotransposon-derived protein RNase H-like domain-containing protein n=1 Tax=Phytophthora megakarya TaxID=4795 RepID=A0A225WIX3_9STRA|nr:hypothetical protein PHMEG_0008521 [Phytophthora megakarya]
MDILSSPSYFNRLVQSIFKDYVSFCQTKLTSTPTLEYADFVKPVYLSVDVSDFAIGGYLFQYDATGAETIIVFWRRKLS